MTLQAHVILYQTIGTFSYSFQNKYLINEVFTFLVDMEQTYEEYNQWLSDPLPGYVKQSYQKALDKLKKYIPHEDQLVG